MRELILTFHGLGEPPPGVPDSERKVWVPVEWLDAVLESMPERGVSLAFDDSNTSDVEHALPRLIRHQRPARFFVLAGQLGRQGRLTVDEVRRLRDAGMRVGSHGLDHCNWRKSSDTQLEAELGESRRVLSEILDEPVEEAACPFGAYDRRVLRAMRSAGYTRAYTSDGGTATVGGWLAARTTVTADRPVDHWIGLARSTTRLRPDPVLVAKRWVKRLR